MYVTVAPENAVFSSKNIPTSIDLVLASPHFVWTKCGILSRRKYTSTSIIILKIIIELVIIRLGYSIWDKGYHMKLFPPEQHLSMCLNTLYTVIWRFKPNPKLCQIFVTKFESLTYISDGTSFGEVWYGDLNTTSNSILFNK